MLRFESTTTTCVAREYMNPMLSNVALPRKRLNRHAESINPDHRGGMIGVMIANAAVTAGRVVI